LKDIHTCRIVVPVYRPLSDAELGVVAHNIFSLRPFEPVLVGGHGRRDLLNNTADSLQHSCGEHISVETFDDPFFQDVPGYNRLLKDVQFFERFSDVSHILICQHDAIVLGRDLEAWMDSGFAFLGAPMFAGYDRPTRPLRFLPTLNGGFSLRDIPATLAVARNARVLERGSLARIAQKLGLIGLANCVLGQFTGVRLVVVPAGLNEDVFWTREIPAVFSEFHIPDPEVAARFAFEACPADLFERIGKRLPLGCHAFERYDPEFWLCHVPTDVLTHVEALVVRDRG
jgi:hypothetical protein